MGQIVSAAAKPKRCNANQLSQVPTPADGEHILVSSDNSMNAEGQGNFDCYIVGDGTTAASALELQNIANGEILPLSRGAVSGKMMFEELRGVNRVNNIATFTKGSFVKSDNSLSANAGYSYIKDLDISSYTKIYIKTKNTSQAYNLLMDANYSVLLRWHSASPYTEEIDLSLYPTAKYLSLSDNNLADHYIDADAIDDTRTKTKISNIEEDVDDLGKSVADVKYGKQTMFEVPITIEGGYYINSEGEKTSGSYQVCENVDISGYSVVVAYGNTYGSAYTCVYDENHVLLLKKQSGQYGKQVMFDIQNECPTAKYLSATSIANRTLMVAGIKSGQKVSDILMDVSEEYFLYKQTIRVTKTEGFYKANRAFTHSTTNQGYKSNLIRVKEGMTFSLTSNGSSNTLNYITYNANLEMVSVISANTYTSEQIVIPAGVRYIEFFSFNTTLIVSCEQLTQESSGSGGGNILAGKTYVAIGDSFTAPIGSEVIEGGRYDGQSKVYPYIIGNRNDMNVLNQGQSGSVLNSYLANARYNSIPAETDYITIWYGINDTGHNIGVGTVDDEPAAISAEGDTTTCGGFNFFFKWLLTNRPFAHVGVIVTDFCGQTRREAIMACCEKWGIPYLDLYNPTIPMIRTRGNTRYTHDTAIAPLGYVEVCSEAKTLRNTVFASDGVSNIHPNNTCHEWQSNIIENFMRGL